MFELTALEKIRRYTKVEPAGRKLGFGDTLRYGHRKHRMSKLLTAMTDAECERVIKEATGLSAYIAEREKKKTETGDECKTVLSPDPKPCECGCGTMAHADRKFRPGHDMKLKSALRKAAAGGDASAEKELRSRGWALERNA